MKIYYGNLSCFGFPLHDLTVPFLYAVVYAGAGLALILLLGWFTPLYRTLAVLIFVFVSLLWAQGNLFVWPYGVLDASAIDWSGFAVQNRIEIAAWCSGLIFALIFGGRFHRLMPYPLIVLCCMQAADGWIIRKNALPPELDKLYVMDESDEFKFSAGNNIIVIILDAFQGSVFDEIITKTPAYASIFNGFTFFRNALCAIPSTKISLPHILSGVPYDNSITVHQYQRRSLLTQSLPLRMRKLGYRTGYYDVFGYGFLPLEPTLWNNVRRTTSHREHVSEYLKLIDASVFRLMPQMVKKKIYYKGNWGGQKKAAEILNILFLRAEKTSRVPARTLRSGRRAPVPKLAGCCGDFPMDQHYDIKFISRLLNEAVVDNELKTFKFFHLQGLHPPRNFDENFRYDPALNENVDSMPGSGRGTLKLMSMLLDKFRKLGIYDDSTMVIIGDHGNARSVNPSSGPVHKKLDAQSLRLNFDSVKGCAIPLVLIKPANSSGPLRISTSPVGLGDIPETLMELLGHKGDFQGRSMLDCPATERKRYFWLDTYHEGKYDYYGDLQEFLINGDVYNDASWSATGKLLKPKQTTVESFYNIRDAYIHAMLPLKPVAKGVPFAEPPFGNINGTYVASRAFDKIVRETGWQPVVAKNGKCAAQATLGLRLNSPAIVKAYSVTTRFDILDQAPKTWELQASNDGQIWDTLDTVKNDISWEAGGKVRIFRIPNTLGFLYYRMKVDESQDGRCIYIDELELFA
ncbi:MAG: sulfatase-like hydrolase/transferase [Elusimicrobiales bacterium]